jgi:hypothetical protein
MPTAEKKCRVQISAYLEEPALVECAFDRIRREAKLYGLPDIGPISIELKVTVSGYTYERHIERLEARLDQLWLGGLNEVQFEEGASDA